MAEKLSQEKPSETPSKSRWPLGRKQYLDRLQASQQEQRDEILYLKEELHGEKQRLLGTMQEVHRQRQDLEQIKQGESGTQEFLFSRLCAQLEFYVPEAKGPMGYAALIQWLNQDPKHLQYPIMSSIGRCFVDNATGTIEPWGGGPYTGPSWSNHREGAPGLLSKSWARQRMVVHALTKAFGLAPILPANPIQRYLCGIGLSDQTSYAQHLQNHFLYFNTFLHKDPVLNITAPNSSAFSKESLDFIISSDVFEHTAPPAQDAFAGAAWLLKPGGKLILTVPFETKDAPLTEHFADLHKYELIEDSSTSSGFRLENETKDGQSQVFTELLFHGGPGQTLEMRAFTKKSLVEFAENAGFDIEFIEDELPALGISQLPHWGSNPMILTKRSL